MFRRCSDNLRDGGFNRPIIAQFASIRPYSTEVIPMKSGSFAVLVLLLMAMAINSPTGELATAAPVPKEVINVQMTCRDCTCRTWVAYRPFESDTATEFFVDGPGLGQTTL